MSVRTPAPAPAAPGGSPPALRLRRPRWDDRRLLAGLLLVAVSTVLGARLLAPAGDEVAVWVAGRDLAAGTVLRDDDLEARRVRVGGAADRYVDASAAPPAGRALLRDVGSGELLPAAAVADGEPRDRRTVSVPVERRRMPADLRRGERVDVYATDDAGSDARTTRVASGAVVVAVEDGGGRFGAGDSSAAVQVDVPEDAVAALVAGVAGADVDLVRVPS